MISLMLHEVRTRRRMIVGWTIGLAFFGVMYMSFYPSLPDEILDLDMESIEIYKSLGVETMATFDGYLQSSVFNFLPLLVGAFGIVLGAGALAGEEDAGTLELLASLPISRLRLFIAKAAAVMLVAFVVILAVALMAAGVFSAIESEIDTPVTATDLTWVFLAHFLIAFVFISLALFLGALLPTRGSTTALSSTLLVLTFFGNNLAGLVTELERVQPWFPFSYFRRIAESLTGEVPWEDVLVLVTMGLAFLVLGALSFVGRDLQVNAWPWQRLRSGAPLDRGRFGQALVRVAAAIVVVAIAIGAVAYLNEADLALGSEDEDVAAEPSATNVSSATATPDEEGTSTAEADATATPEPDVEEATETPEPEQRIRPTATLRIGG